MRKIILAIVLAMPLLIFAATLRAVLGIDHSMEDLF